MTSFKELFHSSLRVDKHISAASEMKVKITRWNAVATWQWDVPEDDVCGICQIHFDGACPTCKYPGDDCSLCELDADKVASGITG